MRHSVLAAALAALAVLAGGTLTASAAGGPSALDTHWLKASAQGDKFEILGGTMALQKSQDAAIRRLAQRVVADHGKSLAEARRTGAKLGITVPASPTPSMQWELAVVRAMSGD